jgi:N-6 DNA Methylase
MILPKPVGPQRVAILGRTSRFHVLTVSEGGQAIVGADDEHLIRKALLDARLIDAVISLPLNVFYGAGVPACLLILPVQSANPWDTIAPFEPDHEVGAEIDSAAPAYNEPHEVRSAIG